MNALVFVHGLSGSGRWWRPVLPFFEDRDVRVVDLPRFSALRFGPHDAAGWLGDWLAAEGLVGADVAGHSLGGLIAAQLAAQRPDAVRRLVLVAPAGVPTGRGIAGHVLPLLATARDAPPALLAHALRDGLRAGPASLLRGGFHAMRHDIRDDLAAVRVPTLLVWGERDPLVPRRLADEWTRGLPDVRLVVLPDAGHVPMFDTPAELAGHIRTFLLGGLGETSSEPSGRAARPDAASSVAPVPTGTRAPCVLASERPTHPDDERRSTKPS